MFRSSPYELNTGKLYHRGGIEGNILHNELFPRNHQDSAAHQYQSDEDGAVQHAVFR